MQADGPGQDTLSRLPPAGVIPGGLGTGTMAQPFPFQCSASSACRAELSMPVPPTATQLDGLGQETPIKPLGSAPGRLGVFWISQVLPFQDSARLTGVLKLLAEGPAATHLAADGQETVAKKLNDASARLGVCWIAHWAPFHRSASVTKVPELFPYPPTALQLAADVQATPLRKLNSAPEGFGVGWMLHLVPFQCSAKVPEFEPPTAVHDDAEVHDTPLSPAPPCGGLGVAWIAQVVPFQCSAKVPEFENPTAVHDTAEVQATPNRAPPPAAGLGVR
jgi:hypothetical protein